MTASGTTPILDPIPALIAAWPADLPLAVLHSADPGQPHSRWSMIATPSQRKGGGGAVGSWLLAVGQKGLLPTLATPSHARPIAHPALPASGTPHDPTSHPPFTSGYVGYLSYDSGRLLEPAARHSTPARDDRRWPLAQWLRIDDALIFDHHLRQWWGLGDFNRLIAGLAKSQKPAANRLSPFHSSVSAPAYLDSVRRALDYIRAGDIYQVNLAHRLTAALTGSPRSFYTTLAAAARPWYGAYLELPDGRAIASASPELFLDFDPATRRIITRPMKGTRRGDADPRDLLDSAKDRAELTMITDLMRNDLGRICDFGSVRVDRARDLEHHGSSRSPSHPLTPSPSHPSVLQTTSTISGVVRRGLTPADILTATFPGGSITGAPKIRAMQIIDELEPVARGPYCGCIGFLGDDTRLTLSIAIRTALLTPSLREGAGEGSVFPSQREGEGGGFSPSSAPEPPHSRVYTLDYSVGAGIVADSDPESEWEETLAKAAILRIE